MANAVGPVYVGGFEEFVVTEGGEQYTILYLPDLNNDKLQREGKAPVYYWVPGQVRLARKGDVGPYKFHHTHFVGVLSEDLHVGVDGEAEVQGGMLAFTTTSRYPTTVLKKAEEQLLAKFRGKDERYWGWRTQAAPTFRIVPITSNTTAVTSLAPGRDGTAPAEAIGSGAPASGGGGGVPPGPRSMVRLGDFSGPVMHGRRFSRRSNLDAWAFHLQGQGAGSVTGGENAYAGLMGAYPSEIIWAGFHGSYSPLAVAQNLIMPVWSQEIYLRIDGNWDRVFQHFSAHANARYLWFAADVKAEFNNLRISGGITVELHVDGTIPGAGKLEEAIEKRSDLIVQKFMEQATQRIFAPPTPEVKPAEAPSGGLLSRFFGGGGGVALNYRRDATKLSLHYEETRHHRYAQPTTISSSLEGFFDEIKADPQAERRYFSRLVLGDLGRKVHRIVKPVVRWPKAENEHVGDPVAFVSVDIGYPDAQGHPQWRPHVFQSTDTDEQTTWKPNFAQRKMHEVENPPAGWTPDKAFVRRRVHLKEAMGATDDPHVKVFIEKNEVELDPGEHGSLSSDTVIEVRADSVGKLEVAMTGIDATLQDAGQIVEVELQAHGKTHDGHDRAPVRFVWQHHDQEVPRFWEIFTGQLDYVPRYSYRTHVTVKGTLFSQGMSWTGPWLEGAGNGALMVHVPLADEEGVTVRRLTPREVSLGTDGAATPSPTPPPAVGVHEGPIGGPPPGPTGARPVGAPPPVASGTGPGTPPPSGARSTPGDARTVDGYFVAAGPTPPPSSAARDAVGSPSATERSPRDSGKGVATLDELPEGEGWVRVTS
jgi:hypothetical protein